MNGLNSCKGMGGSDRAQLSLVSTTFTGLALRYTRITNHALNMPHLENNGIPKANPEDVEMVCSV
jgi:hypothetical protein